MVVSEDGALSDNPAMKVVQFKLIKKKTMIVKYCRIPGLRRNEDGKLILNTLKYPESYLGEAE